MKSLHRLGLVLFITGFACWIFTLTLSQYRLTDAIIDQVVKTEHKAVVHRQTAFMKDKLYSNNWAFIKDFRGAIDAYNADMRAKKAWSEVIYDNYTFDVAKRASLGMLTTGNVWIWFWLSFGLATLGGLLYAWAGTKRLPGIQNNRQYRHPATDRGWIGISVGVFLIGFYIALYFYPEYLTNWVLLVDPISRALNAGPASRWFLYGFLYTLVILVMGIRMLINYRHSRYQQLRTLSVMFFQTAFAFLIPEIMQRLNQPYQDLKNIWPLDYTFFFDYKINEKLQAGSLGIFMLVWGIVLALVAVPVMTYFFGKRWYCSWVCGCGGLAETLGDPYRHLSDKTLKAWKAERVIVHGVLVFAVVMTLLVLYTYFTGQSTVLGFLDSYSIRSTYGLYVGSIFAGVVGTGFYPLMGNRVWCRFGCPLAAYLGLVQRFKSRFRITTNGGQCISCGNCSAYCEMGIDVRAYAQRGQDIVRSSCVGCGICSAVCPRGVLNLEVGPVSSRKI
ncbi:4Fe-4S binding protein [Spirosoma endbachense]|uniref:4Fe-4S binding protein n=1 Tax=Spirosoma endbachense TaxID=2666025 RepID=A0A6P1VVV0_9BACT|nr:4Fe-4S binding protein [Spirosoma endbachense]QHV95897.1 4Fe-4S binding protein [Spirosoma endbachense]